MYRNCGYWEWPFWGMAKWPPIGGWLLLRVAAHRRLCCYFDNCIVIIIVILFTGLSNVII